MRAFPGADKDPQRTEHNFAAKPGEPIVVTARRLIAALRLYRQLTRRQIQNLLYPDETYDVRRARATGVLIHYCRDRGWVRDYGRQLLPTVEGLDQLTYAEGIQPQEAG